MFEKKSQFIKLKEDFLGLGEYSDLEKIIISDALKTPKCQNDDDEIFQSFF